MIIQLATLLFYKTKKIFLTTILLVVLPQLLTAQIKADKDIHEQPAFNVEVFGSGLPIYLIPGLASGGEVWYDTVTNLKDKYECHVFTLAGFAGKEPVEQKPYLSEIKKKLEEYIKKRGKGVIIGHSLGGFLTLWMTSENSDIAEKAVIVDSYPFLAALRQPGATEATVQFPREAMIQQMTQLDSSQYKKQQQRTLSTMITDKQHIETALQWSLESDRATIVHAMGDLMQTDLRDELTDIETPTLVMIAGNVSVNGQRLYSAEQMLQIAKNQYQNHANKTIKVADNAKHFIMMDDPEWFSKTLQSFLDVR